MSYVNMLIDTSNNEHSLTDMSIIVILSCIIAIGYNYLFEELRLLN